MLARDLITRSPVLVHREAPVTEAVRRMRDADVGSVVVVEKGEPVGILTDRDVALDLARGYSDGRLVQDIMTPVPVSIHTQADVETCLERMEENGVRRILILEDTTIVGVVALDDILMHLAYLMGKASSLIHAEITPHFAEMGER